VGIGTLCIIQVMRTAACACIFHGHSCDGNRRIGWRQEGGLGEHGTGAVIFRGRGRFRVPPVITDLVSPPSVCAEWSRRDPDLASCLVEGVRSGSRKRNAATTSPQARGDARPESQRIATSQAGAALCGQCAGLVRPSAVNIIRRRSAPPIDSDPGVTVIPQLAGIRVATNDSGLAQSVFS
jgi:hypothetical protein